METAIEDVLALWALHHHPPLLEDDDLFDALLMFIHRLTRAAANAERERLAGRRN